MRKQLTLLCFLLSFIGFQTKSSAQLADGAIAPDFTLTDLDGNTHNLYSLLDDGKNVVLDFSATWCPPCWSYHNSGQLEELYANRGPNGANDVEIFYIEADGSTNLNCMYGQSGCNDTSLGDWTNVPYPIFNLEGGDLSVASDYSISYYPTIYIVSAADKRIWETGQASHSVFENLIDFSFPLSASYTSIDQSCSNFGSIDLTTNFGYGSLSYAWNDGNNTEDNNFLTGGIFDVKIIDDYGYFINVGPITIASEDFNPNMQIFPTIVQEISCAGQSDGTITLNSTGGFSNNYSYQWNNGYSTSTVSDLSGGFYEVTVTDELGCTNSTFFELTEPPMMTTNNMIEGSCSGSNAGSLEIAVTEGVAPYAYDIGAGYSSSNVFENLSPGNYELVVSDFNGCTMAQTVNIPQYALPNASFAASGTVIDCDTPSLSFAGNDDVDIDHQWLLDGVSVANTVSYEATAAGEYTYIVTNTITNCQAESSIEVTSTGGIPMITSDEGVINCISTEVNLCAATDPANTITWNIDGQDVTETCVTVTTAGSYVATATAPNGCTNTSISTVSMNMESASISMLTAGTLDCDSGSAVISAMVSGAADVITWTDANGNVVNENNEVSTEVFNSGVYTIVATNNESGCTSSQEVLVDENTAIPVISSLDYDPLTCIQSTTMLSATVDMADDDYTVEWSDANGNIIGDQNSIVVDQAGVYSLAVQSLVNSCIGSAELTVIENLTTVSLVEATTEPITCINTTGKVNLDITDEEGAYTVSWYNSDDELVSQMTNLETENAGIYKAIMVLTETGCQSEVIAELTEIIDLPIAEFTLVEAVSSFDLSASMSPNSTYAWSINGLVESTESEYSILLDETQLYDICLTVTNDCGAEEECNTYQYVAPFSASVTKQDNLCGGDASGSIFIELQGGLPTYLIEITGPNGFTSDNNDLTDLENGVYSYLIIDAIDNQVSGTVVINSPEIIESTSDVVNATGVISNDGSISLDVTGGVAPYTFLWSNGSTTEDQENLVAGSYSCIIIDANDCQISTGEIIVQFTSSITDLADLGISIYPNPARDFINIDVKSTDRYEMHITDVNGRVVMVKSNVQSGEIDISILDTGVYFIRLSEKSKSAIHRLIKL